MHIQEVILDGFKSYARRTVVEGFDPHFNAITGLNGSGKSNILDAICFVLGITNLSQVRAGNLSELVYKQGQAGVNKATVTIIFNNEDPSSSPVGYEQSRQVTVTRQVLLGGKSKYLINGRTVTASQVQNLFHSVQLNVNNPHFLIMQGRITKVLNMKPNEILAMVEEAAGTRMYETKKVAALKTITKKQLKLDELNAVLNEEITPTLERLRGEKEAYLRWSKIQADIARMERFFIAIKFMQAQKALESNNEGSAEIEEKVQELEYEAKDYASQVVLKQQEIDEATAQLRGEFDESHVKAKAKEEEHSKALVKITSTWQNAKSSAEKAEAELENARNAVREIEQAVSGKQDEMANTSNNIQSKVEAAKDADEKVLQLTTTYQNMSAGVSTGESDEGRTLPEQISQAHSDSKNAQAKVEQAKMKIKHLTKEIKTVEKEIKKQGKSSQKMATEREKKASQVEKLQSQLEKLEFSLDEFNSLEQHKTELVSLVSELSDRVDTLSAKLEGRLSFEYSDPVRGFDRSKVKGLMAKLIQVKDKNHATAIEITAGGKLYQVVVDEAITGKALLSRGKLARRVTIIPLDKIRSKTVSNSANKKAREVAESLNTSSSPAIELVGFDEEIRLAVEYVFGNTLVVDGMKAANLICDATKTRTVTLEGDVYDPSGTISGGSSNKIGTTLSGLADLTEASSLLKEKQEVLKEVKMQLDSMSAASGKFDKLSSKLELAKASLENVEKHLSQTSYGMLVENRDTMSADLDDAEAECVAMNAEQAEKWALYEELQAKETELTQARENRLVEIEQALKDAKLDATKKNSIARDADSLTQTVALEIESLEREVEVAQKTEKEAETALGNAISEEAKIQIQVGEVRSAYEESKAALDALESRLNLCSAKLVELKHSKSDLSKKAEDAKLRAKKLSVEVERICKERSGAKKLVDSMLKKHVWIESEQSAFGVPGGDYDFEGTDAKQVESQLESLNEEQDSLSKKINKKVMGMIEKAESEYTELLRKRKVVENDKTKIQKVIEELDVKKKSELERTWVKVNRDFGSIFSTLLPGAFAKLTPPEGMQAWEGLEVKVAFGQVWKESLSELSGGQRSLLALSLILSLLLFKPAPMYILDEVDAALDLSHTQNIGNMLKTHFSQSQFVVVSLKEGMFNNANVIFRTKFVDGVSTVTRTIGIGSSRNRALAQNENEEGTEFTKPVATTRRGKRGKENTAA